MNMTETIEPCNNSESNCTHSKSYHSGLRGECMAEGCICAAYLAKNDCFCCTCPTDEISGAVAGWDPACHNHGAHGIRGCEKHNVESQNCDCGCGFKVRKD